MTPPAVTGVATSIAAFVAPAPQGPVSAPVAIAGIADFERNFSGTAAAWPLGRAVSLFFANGGTSAYVVRVLASTPPAIADYGDGAAGTGIYSLDAVAILNLLCLPAVADEPALFALYPLAAAYCARRQAMLLVDLPRDTSVAQAQQWMTSPGASVRSSNVAAYYPWLAVPDPVGGSPMHVPCAGAVAGVFARQDAARGVWRAPAGVEATISGAVGLARTLTDDEVTLLSALGLDCLRSLPGTGPVIWDDRTMAGADGAADDYKYVATRRLALFLEQSIDEGTRWAVFEPNDRSLWSAVATAVSAFMLELFRTGAFAGATPNQAFFVRCDRTTMTETDVEQGVVNIVVGFAPLRPAEFVIITVRQLVQPC
jgi:Bacteriophage tail sheath protein